MVQNAWVRLQSFSRYLKAMEYRIEKLQGNGPRDRQSMIEFESLYKPYRQLVDKTQVRFGSELDEFGWLLEEWRVSLFAQPLGTREPVSLKRLTKRWSEIAKG
jgi:ATP-dependent helicase HrpA